MPFTEVMHKFKTGQLRSGSKTGKPVKNRNQAIAIMLSEKRAASNGKEEYQSKSGIGPSSSVVEEASKKKKLFPKKK